MNVSPTTPTPGGLTGPGLTGPNARRARTPEEAAKQFEAILVRQFVQVMTKDLFQSHAEGAMLPAAQADLQRDALTDALTDHLVESGSLRLRDLLLRQWGAAREAAPEAPRQTPPAAEPLDAADPYATNAADVA